VYIDTSGIAINPPKFIDVLQNKTINFNIGKYAIKIGHISIGSGLTTVNKIAMLYNGLDKLTDQIPKNRMDEISINFRKVSIYKLIVHQIYLLSKHFVDNKRKYKKELFKFSNENQEKIMLITEQIFDYWKYIKKLLALLGRGGTLRQTIGERYTWNSYETDTNGKVIIKPRFGLSTN
ncbi:MAG: hypothetical protein KKC77_19235, partial [Proteobacteria bacterium]|nr:hypothetical protein [Pseudomonadota bacterium]